VLLDDFIPRGIRTWISSTSKGGSEQSFLTIGTLACHKGTSPDDDSGDHYQNVSDFINIKSCFRHSCADCWYSSIVDFIVHGENSNIKIYATSLTVFSHYPEKLFIFSPYRYHIHHTASVSWKLNGTDITQILAIT